MNECYKPIHGLIFTENCTVLHTSLPKIQILIFTSYLGHHKDTFFQEVSENQLSTAQFSIFFDKNFMKFCWNVLSYTKSSNKIIHLVCLKKMKENMLFLPFETHVTP